MHYFKRILSSICDKEQIMCMIKCERFQSLLCVSLFDREILLKLKTRSNMSITEVGILTNLFETISNIW